MTSQKKSLHRCDLSPDPISQFRFWLQDAEDAAVPMPIAMTLATSSLRGRVSARIVLLRGIDERGFLFYTNYDSDKASDLTDNPFAALVFHWQALSRQVRIEGTAEILSEVESDEYFNSRPRGNQLAAHASPQSQVVDNRHALEERFKQVDAEFEGNTVSKPAYWGGYRVVPELVEFWQEGDHRLHDRLRYRLDADGRWVVERLGP